MQKHGVQAKEFEDLLSKLLKQAQKESDSCEKSEHKVKIIKEHHFLNVGEDKINVCKVCERHIAIEQDRVESTELGPKVHWFTKAINCHKGDITKRTVGGHTFETCTIWCKFCKSCLGWKYLKSYSKGMAHREGKVVLNRNALQKEEIEEIYNIRLYFQ